MTSSDTTLQLIDAALAEGAATTTEPGGRSLQHLALELRDDAPVPAPAFADALDARVRSGFARRRRRRRPTPGVLAFAGGLAASAVATVILLAPGTQHESPSVAPFSHRVPLSGATAQGTADLTARRVARSAQVTLAAPGDRLQEVADGAVSVTTRHRGFVQREAVTTGGTDAGGSLELRVPVGELEGTLRDLSALAHVRGRTQTADDVTQQYTSTASGLARARARRADLVRRIARAGSGAEADRLRSALAAVNSQIRSLGANLRAFDRETRFADVQVDLQAEHGGAATGSSTRRALHDALGMLVGSVDVAIRAAGVLVPLGLVAAALGLGARTLRRRRREAILA